LKKLFGKKEKELENNYKEKKKNEDSSGNFSIRPPLLLTKIKKYRNRNKTSMQY
jgi:hypothetical protein